MFPKTFFPQGFFTGVYFPPTTTFTLIDDGTKFNYPRYRRGRR